MATCNKYSRFGKLGCMVLRYASGRTDGQTNKQTYIHTDTLIAILRNTLMVRKGIVFPYSLPSVGPGADPGVLKSSTRR